MSPQVRKILRAAALLIVLSTVQLLLGRFLAIGGVTPDLPLIGLLFIGHRLGRLPATILGFGAGLLVDLASGEVVGILAFAKTLTGFGSGLLYDEERTEPFGRLPRFILLSTGLIIFHNFASLLLYFRDVGADLISTFAQFGLGGAAYSSVLVLISALFVSRRPRRFDLQRNDNG